MGLFDKKVQTHYKIFVECENCKITGVLLAAKGELKEEAVKEDNCNNCGCSTLKMIDDKEYYKRNPPTTSTGLF